MTENSMIRYLPIVVVAVLLAGGCGKRDGPNTVVPPSPAVKPEIPDAAAVPTPLPQVAAGERAEVQSPQPGQANDHSSPAFKDGGMPDKKK
jgi:hypothetical protein